MRKGILFTPMYTLKYRTSVYTMRILECQLWGHPRMLSTWMVNDFSKWHWYKPLQVLASIHQCYRTCIFVTARTSFCVRNVSANVQRVFLGVNCRNINHSTPTTWQNKICSLFSTSLSSVQNTLLHHIPPMSALHSLKSKDSVTDGIDTINGS